jgi:hypothetical protein
VPSNAIVEGSGTPKVPDAAVISTLPESVCTANWDVVSECNQTAVRETRYTGVHAGGGAAGDLDEKGVASTGVEVEGFAGLDRADDGVIQHAAATGFQDPFNPQSTGALTFKANGTADGGGPSPSVGSLFSNTRRGGGYEGHAWGRVAQRAVFF